MSAVLPQPAPQKLLVIDDDRKLCRLVASYLEPMGYSVEARHTGPEGLEAALSGEWQAILLDVMMPGMDGFEVLRRLRASSRVPVLMLTARGDEADRIVGLEVGADDYLPKTFSVRELLARLRAVTRRAAHVPVVASTSSVPDEAQDPVVVGDLVVEPDTRMARLAGEALVLTPVEFDLLLCLARACGRVKTREQLLDQIRDRDYEVFDRSVDVHVSALRRKLGDDPKNPRYIRTVRTAGYMLMRQAEGSQQT